MLRLYPVSALAVNRRPGSRYLPTTAASIEAEITDGMSNRRLAAVVDERAGTKAIRAIGGKWKDVRLAFDYWAERLRERLAELRSP